MMHCSCDDRFRPCLKQTATSSADVVGRFFFNVIRTPCFTFAEEETCIRRLWWGGCAQWEMRKTAKWRAARAY